MLDDWPAGIVLRRHETSSIRDVRMEEPSHLPGFEKHHSMADKRNRGVCMLIISTYRTANSRATSTLLLYPTVDLPVASNVSTNGHTRVAPCWSCPLAVERAL